MDSALRIWTRAIDSVRPPPIDDFTVAMAKRDNPNLKLKDLFGGLSKEEVLDRMLLSLADALHLDAAIGWSNGGVDNLPVDETLELARYWQLGKSVGSQPTFFWSLCVLLRPALRQ